MSPRISIVIEWENALLSDKLKIPSLFSRLHQGITRLSEPVEVNIVYDPGSVDVENVGRLLANTPLVRSDLVRLGFHPLSGEHYYELKNYGVQKSSGEIVVFADSDIDPEEDWLSSLVHFLDHHEDHGMVGGFTYVKPVNLLTKAFSAGWFFPLKPEAEIVYSPARFVWANNCAYRRSVFLAHPYRTSHYGETRNACNRQLAEMTNAGIKTANISSAVVAHPAPNGLRHFVIRGLAEGRDYAVDLLLAGNPDEGVLSPHLRRLVHQVVGKLRKAVVNSITEGKRIEAKKFEPPILVSIMLAYYSLYAVGATWTLINPQSTAGKWRI